MDRHEMRSLISNTSVVVTAKDIDKLSMSSVYWPKGEPGTGFPVRGIDCRCVGTPTKLTKPSDPVTIGEARSMAATTPGGYLEVDGDDMTATLWAEADGVAWPVHKVFLL